MKLTLTVIFLMAAAFLFELTVDADALFAQYGFSGENVLARPYILITSIFLHASLGHLLSNIFALFFFGSAVESELGRGRTLLIFLAGAIAGDMFSLFFYPFSAIAVGASAGVFALMGAGILVKPFDLSMYPFIVPIPLALIGMLYAIYNLYGLFFDPGSGISYAGHFGGLAVGLYYGFKRQGVKKSIAIIILSLLALALIPVIVSLIRDALAK